MARAKKTDKKLLDEDKSNPLSDKKTADEVSLTSDNVKNNTRQMIWILISMVILVIVIVLVYFMLHRTQTFDYQDLKFSKQKFGDIPVYYYYYFFTDHTGQKIQYNLFLRTDPRENDIPVNGEIIYPKGRDIFISTNTTGLTQCNMSAVAISTLAAFLTNNDFQVRGGTPVYEESLNSSVRYVTCESHPSNTVILIQSGNKTQITRNGDLCYVVDIANCQIMDAVEKFELRSIIDAKNRGAAENTNFYDFTNFSR